MQKKLDKIYEGLARCMECPLGAERTNPVRDTADPGGAALVLVGEAPGANEVKLGVPFVGEAGKKLDSYLAEAGLSRKEVYVTSVVRCRPTTNGGRRNRTPVQSEISACGRWLDRELAVIRPKVVATLGNIALKWLCGSHHTIGDCHGRVIQAHGVAVYPMYHPAAAIYKKDLEPLIMAEFRELRRLVPGR